MIIGNHFKIHITAFLKCMMLHILWMRSDSGNVNRKTPDPFIYKQISMKTHTCLLYTSPPKQIKFSQNQSDKALNKNFIKRQLITISFPLFCGDPTFQKKIYHLIYFLKLKLIVIYIVRTRKFQTDSAYKLSQYVVINNR